MFYTTVPFQPEKEFILRCMRDVIIRDEVCPELDPGFLRKLDWDWIIKTSDTHRVLCFVTYILIKRNLLRHIDAPVQETLRVGLLKSRQSNWLKQQQFQTVNVILNEHAVAVIPLKGSLLTHLIYANLPFRQMSDIDIMVEQTELKKAFTLLTAAGFRRLNSQSSNRWQEKICAETDPLWGTEVLGRVSLARGGLELDLHFNPRYRIGQKYIGMDVSGLWERATSLPQLGANIYAPDPKDLILHLLLHTIEFYSPRLIQVLDTASVIDKYRLFREGGSEQMNLPSSFSSMPSISAFINAINELFSIKHRASELSPETTEIFERFFSRTAVPDETDEGFRADNSITGISMFKRIKSPWKRVVFISGYFVPAPHYYPHKSLALSYLTHWRRLISKALRLGRLSFRRLYGYLNSFASSSEG